MSYAVNKWHADLPTQRTIFSRVWNQTQKRKDITIFVAIQTTKKLFKYLGIDSNLINNYQFFIPDFSISKNLKKSFSKSVKHLLSKKVRSGVSLKIRSPETEIRRRIFSELAYILSDNYYALLVREYIEYTHKYFPQALAYLLIISFKYNLITAYFSASNQNGHYQWLVQASSIVNSQPGRCKTHCIKFQAMFNKYGTQYDFEHRTSEIKKNFQPIKRKQSKMKIKQILDKLDHNPHKQLKKKFAVRNPTSIVSIIYEELQLLVLKDLRHALKQYIMINSIIIMSNNSNMDECELFTEPFGEPFGCTYNNAIEKVVILIGNEIKENEINLISDSDSDYVIESSKSESNSDCVRVQKAFIPEIVSRYDQKDLSMQWGTDLTPSPTPSSMPTVFQQSAAFLDLDIPDFNFDFISVANVSNVSRGHRRKSSILEIPAQNLSEFTDDISLASVAPLTCIEPMNAYGMGYPDSHMCNSHSMNNMHNNSNMNGIYNNNFCANKTNSNSMCSLSNSNMRGSCNSSMFSACNSSVNNTYNGMNSNCNDMNSNCNGMNGNCNGMIDNCNNSINGNCNGMNSNCNGMNGNCNGMNVNCNNSMNTIYNGNMNGSCNGMNRTCNGLNGNCTSSSNFNSMNGNCNGMNGNCNNSMFSNCSNGCNNHTRSYNSQPFGSNSHSMEYISCNSTPISSVISSSVPFSMASVSSTCTPIAYTNNNMMNGLQIEQLLPSTQYMMNNMCNKTSVNVKQFLPGVRPPVHSGMQRNPNLSMVLPPPRIRRSGNSGGNGYSHNMYQINNGMNNVNTNGYGNIQRY